MLIPNNVSINMPSPKYKYPSPNGGKITTCSALLASGSVGGWLGL